MGKILGYVARGKKIGEVGVEVGGDAGDDTSWWGSTDYH